MVRFFYFAPQRAAFRWMYTECQHMTGKISIAFGSAPRREADSQPISPLARPAVSETETHSLGFLSLADTAPSSGEVAHGRASSGRTVIQPTPVGPRPTWRRCRDSNRRLKALRWLHYHSTGGGVTVICLPTAWCLLSEKF